MLGTMAVYLANSMGLVCTMAVYSVNLADLDGGEFGWIWISMDLVYMRKYTSSVYSFDVHIMYVL